MIKIKYFVYKYLNNYLSLIAIVISIFTYCINRNNYLDKKTNNQLNVEIAKYKSLSEYSDYIVNTFKKDSDEIDNKFIENKGLEYSIEHYDLIQSIILKKITYDLINSSYKNFFKRNELINIYESSGNVISMDDVLNLSPILFANNIQNDVTAYDFNKLINNYRNNEYDSIKISLNNLITAINNKKETVSNDIEKLYYIGLSKDNLDKDLLDEYFSFDKNSRGLTLVQENWFHGTNVKKMSEIDGYITLYFSNVIFEKSLKQMQN
jgi:hypothetical protein